MKITYEGADVLFIDKYDYVDNEIKRAAIACTKTAEDALYNFAIRLMNQTGLELGTLRTVFGLTFYAHNHETKKALMGFVQEKGFTVDYGHV